MRRWWSVMAPRGCNAHAHNLRTARMPLREMSANPQSQSPPAAGPRGAVRPRRVPRRDADRRHPDPTRARAVPMQGATSRRGDGATRREPKPTPEPSSHHPCVASAATAHNGGRSSPLTLRASARTGAAHFRATGADGPPTVLCLGIAGARLPAVPPRSFNSGPSRSGLRRTTWRRQRRNASGLDNHEQQVASLLRAVADLIERPRRTAAPIRPPLDMQGREM